MTPKETTTYFSNSNIEYKDLTFKISDEHQIHYIETGDSTKSTLFFLHGSPGSWDAYKKYLSDLDLQKQFRLIAIDRPGFGYSNFGTAEDLETQANLILPFIKSKNNNQPFTLIGHSMGGPIAVKLATKSPTLFKNLVILAGSIDPNAETPENWRPILMTKPIRYLIPGAFRTSNDELWWLKDDLKIMKTQLHNITSNILIIHGTEDSLVPYSNVSFMEKAFINARKIEVIPIEKADHFIPWTHFEIIKKSLMSLQN
ncbi:alpha/beta fold hydrolase [Flavobacterium urocaniciphilum]|uniref:Pimeloyl-ACP methyl ester carboxylesterase n=1 Tax=Flavobacterium urocaniciphilum TaxID=1299341 RepID=A0A1H9B3Q6_9FLAO|nr:alpha/beta hydrolase [Flavobacterium urocaniciphilum]SEP83584.1 Pimeloyl-ACP methyl ester carboxylesterase [Flavobacterium urocaniciphilum]